MPLASNKSSIGTVNPPMVEYIYAAALWVWPDMRSVSVLTLISGMIAIVAAAWVTRRLFGKRAAFWASLIFAVNPWSVNYSQVIWNQTMVPVFATLTLVSLLYYFAVNQHPLALISGFIWASCMTQVHPASMIQLVTVGAVMIAFWRKLRVWPVCVGVMLFTLLYVPYLSYENSVGWIDLQAMLDFETKPTSFSPAAILVSLDLLHTQGLHASGAYVRQFDHIATVLFVVSLIYAVARVTRLFRRRHGNPSATREFTGLVIILLWFLLPVLFYLRSSRYLQLYYLVSQVPVHFMLLGVFLQGLHRFGSQSKPESDKRHVLPRFGPTIARVLVGITTFLWIGWQAVATVQIEDTRACGQGNTQLRHVQAAIQTARSLLISQRECKMVVVSKGHNVETSRLSLLREFTMAPDRVLLTDGRRAIAISFPCVLYLDALPNSTASWWLAGTADHLPKFDIAVQGETWRFYELQSDEMNSAEDLSDDAPNAAWVDGVSLVGYEYDRVQAGKETRVTLTWSIDSEPPEKVVHIGVYLLDEGDQVIAQADGPGFDSIQWRAGDRFITWFDLPVPDDLFGGDWRLAVVLYEWPELTRINLASGENIAFLEEIHVMP